MTRKLSRAVGLAQMFCRLANVIDEKIEGTGAVRPIYCQEFATHEMSFELYNVVWPQYLNENMHHFWIFLLEAQDALLKRRSTHASPVFGKVQPSLVAAVVADDPDDADDDWDLEGASGLNDVENVGVESWLRDFHNSFCAKNGKVLGTVAEEFELATELVYQKIAADTDPSAELFSWRALWRLHWIRQRGLWIS